MNRTKYDQSRANLLLVAGFTLVNIIMLASGNLRYFLFSAALPYYLVDLGMGLCGRYPEEMYEGGYASYDFFDNSLFYFLLVVAIVLTLIYFLFFIFSSKGRVGWMIAALVFFIIDTVIMFWANGFALAGIIDIMFHAWVIISLCIGIADHYRRGALQE